MNVRNPSAARSWPGRPGALMRYEWRKLRSLRSTWLTLAALTMIMIGAAVDTVHAAVRSSGLHRVDPIYDTTGVLVAQYAAALLGVLTVAGEYATGAIRSTLLAAPRRGQLYAAKTLVLAACLFTIGTGYAVADLLIVRPLLGDHAAPERAAGLARGVAGTGVYLALIGLLAAGAAAAVRYSAGALGAVVALLLLAPAVIPASWLPQAGTDLLRTAATKHPDHPWLGLAVLAAWTGAATAAGLSALRHRAA